MGTKNGRVWILTIFATVFVNSADTCTYGKALEQRSAETVRIASFNIQVFGTSKMAKSHVVDTLAKVIRNFDIVAIQEVRAKSPDVIPSFIKHVNADGSSYQYVIGPRLGRTTSKEQYTFLYDTRRIEVDTTSVGTMQDPGDRLHRPPLFVRFRSRMLPPEDDIILLGGLNAAPKQFGRLGTLHDITWAVSGTTTNTRRTKTYDNLVFERTTTAEYTGRWGVLDLQSTYGLSLQQALEVSDHNPVWAAFTARESIPKNTASLPAHTGRLN